MDKICVFNPQRILTLDFSISRSGWSFYDKEKDILRMGAKTFPQKVIVKKTKTSSAILSHPALRFRDISLWLEDMLEEFNPELFIYEETYYSANKSAAYISVFFYCSVDMLCAERKITTKAISPTSLKLGWGGDGRCDKKHLQEKVLQRFPSYAEFLEEDSHKDPTKMRDISDALSQLGLWLDNPSVYEPKIKIKKKPLPKREKSPLLVRGASD